MVIKSFAPHTLRHLFILTNVCHDQPKGQIWRLHTYLIGCNITFWEWLYGNSLTLNCAGTIDFKFGSRLPDISSTHRTDLRRLKMARCQKSVTWNWRKYSIQSSNELTERRGKTKSEFGCYKRYCKKQTRREAIEGRWRFEYFIKWRRVNW
jgi:hypothetical protein